MKSLPEQFTNNISGSLSEETCALILKLASEVDAEGSILVAGDGQGRSVIAAALGTEARILAWDTYLNGTESLFPTFVNRARTYKVFQQIVPVAHSVYTISQVLAKRSNNLAVFSISDDTINFLDCLLASIEAAKHTIRRGGKIVMCCTSSANAEEFGKILDAAFPTEYFACSHTAPLVRVYEFENSSTLDEEPGKSTKSESTKKSK